jgi:hypothetical protein
MDYKYDLSANSKKCCGVSNNIQSAVNFEMRIPSKTYFEKMAILSFGGRIAGKIKKKYFKLQWNNGQRKVLYRENGDVIRFIPYAQGTKEGFGDVR